jgi:hypothetical protein
MAPPNPDNSPDADADDFLLQSYARLRQTITTTSSSAPRSSEREVLPSPSTLARALSSLPDPNSPAYLSPLGRNKTHAHLLETILPALNGQALSPRYFGFVTGGVLPIAEAADNLVTALDQNVQVHFPTAAPSSDDDDGAVATWVHSACTAVEDAALRMLISLLDLDLDLDDDAESKGGGGVWRGRTFTTGATASNMLGLACGREAVIAKRLAVVGKEGMTVAEVGLLAACQAAGVREIQVLTSMGHSSLTKAASLVGLGHASIKEVGVVGEPWRLDLDAVERELKRAEGEGVVSIIAVSAGEVNTGRFATNVLDMPKLRSLADRYGAWIHVDGGACPFYYYCLPGWRIYDIHVDASLSLWPLRSCAAKNGRLRQPAWERCGIGVGRQYRGRWAQAFERGTLALQAHGVIFLVLTISSPTITAFSSVGMRPS